MARPSGKFNRQATRLLELLRYLGTEKTNQQLAEDLEVTPAQVGRYLKFLKDSGAIQVEIRRSSFRGNFKTSRKIEVK